MKAVDLVRERIERRRSLGIGAERPETASVAPEVFRLLTEDIRSMSRTGPDPLPDDPEHLVVLGLGIEPDSSLRAFGPALRTDDEMISPSQCPGCHESGKYVNEYGRVETRNHPALGEVERPDYRTKLMECDSDDCRVSKFEPWEGEP